MHLIDNFENVEECREENYKIVCLEKEQRAFLRGAITREEQSGYVPMVF